MSFGDRLRSLRKEKNLTLRELANELGISYSALGKYERNEHQPDFDTLEKIANYFDVRVDWLIGRTDIKTFDELVFINDITHIGEKFYEIDPKIRAAIVDIIDSVYLVINNHIDDSSPDYLEKLHELYRTIFNFEIGLIHDENSYEKITDSGSISIVPENLEPAKLLKFTTYYKNKINSIIDELMEMRLKPTNPSENDSGI